VFDHSIETDTRPEAFGKTHYAVFVLRASGEVRAIDLGDAKPIDAAIAQFRNALRDPASSDLERSSRSVDSKVMKAIRPLLRDTEHLLISPDGLLNLMPFEALVDETGKFLAESRSITYLTSGRDLFRLGAAGNLHGKPLIFAHPAFGVPVSEPTAVNVKAGTRAAQRRSLTSTENLRDTYFGPLNGTAQEARSIQAIFPDSIALTGDSATETSVKQATAPRILHLATHGFFINKGGGLATSTTIENPLLRSGLAFAGANRRGGGKDDGILTALEASGLNLWGTKLVVLSACDTGLGDIRNGEGVYGLRRSFVLAGAESVVMSLWPVSDQVARELMTAYYQNLKKGMGRGEALRQVRLQMIKQPARRHPFYWASFIQSGEWANLDGKR